MVRLCEIPSPSREEGRVAEVVRAELRDLGADVHEDGAAAALPAGCGNIVGRFAPTAEGGVPIMFGTHLDTVPVTGADRGRAGRRPPHQPPRHDPRRRQQVGGRGGAPRHAPGRRRGAPPRRRRAGVHALRGDRAARRARLRPGARCGHASASSTTTRARWGTSWPRAPSLHRISATFVGRAGPRRHHPRVGPQRDPGGVAGDRAHAARPDRRRDHRQHRHDRGRHRDQRHLRALLDHRRGPQPRRARRCRCSSRRCSTP